MRLTPRGETVLALLVLALALTSMSLVGYIESL